MSGLKSLHAAILLALASTPAMAERITSVADPLAAQRAVAPPSQARTEASRGSLAAAPLQVAQVSRRKPPPKSLPKGPGLERAALAGDRAALSEIISLHRDGQYKPRNVAALARLYAARAREGQDGAAVLLGRLYAQGALGRPNTREAIRWFTQAANAGSGEAHKELAVTYALAGRDPEALRHARQHQRGNAAKGSAYLARLFAVGKDVPQNLELARKWAMKASAADAGVGIRVIGDLLDEDASVETLDVLARSLRATRVTTGLPLASIRALVSQLPPAGPEENTLSRFQQAAQSGNPLAALVIAEMLLAEKGPKDPEALRLFAIAAKEPRSIAVDPLVAALSTMEAGDPDKQTLIGYLEDAAKAGNPHAMKALANLYAIGGPVEANPTASLGWYRQAAQKGDVEGAFHTGLAYLLGVGAERNEKEALHWLKQAAKGGNGMARAFSMQIEPPPPAKRPAPASRTKRT